MRLRSDCCCSRKIRKDPRLGRFQRMRAFPYSDSAPVIDGSVRATSDADGLYADVVVKKDKVCIKTGRNAPFMGQSQYAGGVRAGHPDAVGQ